MCSQDINIKQKLDRNLFAYQNTYEYCLKEGITNEEWLRIKEIHKSKNYKSLFIISIKERTINFG